jgi:hypothetical protein
MSALLPLDSRRLRRRCPGHFCVGPSLGRGHDCENRQIPWGRVIEINDGPIQVELLEISEGDQTNPERLANRFAPVGRVELLEDVPKVSLNRRRS